MIRSEMRFISTSVLRGLALLWAVAAPWLALAATCNVPARPLLVSATNLNFGNYNAASGTATTANMTVTVSCQNAADTLPAFVAALSKGVAPTYNPRQMALGANRLNYNIFNQAAFTSIWGDGTGGTLTRSYGGGGNTAAGTGFGRITTGQYVAPGVYTDTITVTITY
jgi:spore coat protein U-like protein